MLVTLVDNLPEKKKHTHATPNRKLIHTAKTSELCDESCLLFFGWSKEFYSNISIPGDFSLGRRN